MWTAPTPPKDDDAVASEVHAALLRAPVELDGLRRTCHARGGLRRRALRTLAWPKLVNVDRYSVERCQLERLAAAPHPQHGLIERDVERSMWHFSCAKRWDKKQLARSRRKLSVVVRAVVGAHKGELHYYQGFHDVCTVALLVAGGDERTAFCIAEAVGLRWLRDAMRADFGSLASTMRLLFPLIGAVDKPLARFLKKSEVESFFAISWLVTWFAHDLDDLDLVARLYDRFLSSHPLFPLYVVAAIVIHRRGPLLACEHAESNDDAYDDDVDGRLRCEFASVHSYLCQLPADLPWETLLDDAAALIKRVPPHRLEKLPAAAERDDLKRLVAAGELWSLDPACSGRALQRHAQPDWQLLASRRQAQGRRPISRSVRSRRRPAPGAAAAAAALELEPAAVGFATRAGVLFGAAVLTAVVGRLAMGT